MLILTVFVLKFQTFSKHLQFQFHKLFKISTLYKDLVYKYNLICRDPTTKCISHPCFLGQEINNAKTDPSKL